MNEMIDSHNSVVRNANANTDREQQKAKKPVISDVLPFR